LRSARAMPNLAGCPNAKNTYHKCNDYCKQKLLQQVAILPGRIHLSLEGPVDVRRGGGGRSTPRSVYDACALPALLSLRAAPTTQRASAWESGARSSPGAVPHARTTPYQRIRNNLPPSPTAAR